MEEDKPIDILKDQNLFSNLSPQIPRKSKFSAKIVISTIAIFLFVVGIASAGYIYQKPIIDLLSNPDSHITPHPLLITPTPSIPMLTEDPATSDWREITTKYYSLKYPHGWSLRDVTATTSDLQRIYFGDKTPINDENYRVQLIHQDLYLDRVKKFLSYGDTGNQNSPEAINEKILDNIKIYQAVVVFSQMDSQKSQYVEKSRSYNILIPISNTTITISGDISDKEIITQIASTFKFVDRQEPTCSPRPACLDSTPQCMIPEPIEGWCK